jgi:hypothetical protein
MEQVSYKKTSDLGSAAYLMMYLYKCVGKQNKFMIFEVEDSAIKEFHKRKLEYLSSEFHDFDSCLMSVKKIEDDFILEPEKDEVYKKVYDLGAAAYLLMTSKGQKYYKIAGRERDSRDHRGVGIVFLVDKGREMDFDERSMKYLSTEFHRFDSCLMSLKKMQYLPQYSE